MTEKKGNIITTFIDREEKEPGTYSVSWDGMDDFGTPCPAGLYFPVIRVKSKNRGVETYNPTAFPWGEEVLAEGLEYDAAEQVIRYTITESAMVRIRVGEKDGGPMHKNICDWKLKKPGSYEEPWDGKDNTGHINVVSTDAFFIAFDSFSVPENSTLLQDSGANENDPKKYKQYPIHPPHGKQLTYYALLSHGLLPDLTISAGFAKSIKSKKGVYQLRSQQAVFIDLAGGELGKDPKETIELYLFVDGKMIHEGPVESLPAQLNMDTAMFSNGSHMVTINLRTSGDRVASTSMNVSIDN